MSQISNRQVKILEITGLTKGSFTTKFCGDDNVKDIVTGYNMFLKFAGNYGDKTGRKKAKFRGSLGEVLGFARKYKRKWTIYCIC